MFAFKDFEHHGRLRDAVQEANAWVKDKGVRVINVETLSYGGTESTTKEKGKESGI